MDIIIESDLQYTYVSLDQASNQLTRFVVDSTRAIITQKAALQVNKSIILINRIMTTCNHEVFFHSLSATLPHMSKYVHRLKLEKYYKQSTNLQRWITYCIDIGIELATKLGLERNLSEIIVLSVTSMALTEERNSALEAGIAKAQTIDDEVIREDTLSILNMIKDESAKILEPTSPDTEIEQYIQKAFSLGINLANSDDQIAEVINIGIDDYNPERVLKDCEYLFMFPSNALGIPAQMMSLPTAGPKWIYCAKNNYATRGFRLDDIYGLSNDYGFMHKY